MSGLSHTFQTRSYEGRIVKKGVRTWFEVNHPEFLATELNKFRVGERISVNVTNKKPKRTENQNRYYWLYLQMIADETGHDMDDLHTLFKGMFLSKGLVEIMGHKVRRAKSTTELSTIQFMEYIRRIEELTLQSAPPTESFVLGDDISGDKALEYPINNLEESSL